MKEKGPFCGLKVHFIYSAVPSGCALAASRRKSISLYLASLRSRNTNFDAEMKSDAATIAIAVTVTVTVTTHHLPLIRNRIASTLFSSVLL